MWVRTEIDTIVCLDNRDILILPPDDNSIEWSVAVWESGVELSLKICDTVDEECARTILDRLQMAMGSLRAVIDVRPMLADVLKRRQEALSGVGLDSLTPLINGIPMTDALEAARERRKRDQG